MQHPESPNRAALISVARAVEELLPQLVFVGGHVTELLVTDESAVRIGVTDDVDVIVQSTSQSDFYRVETTTVAPM